MTKTDEVNEAFILAELKYHAIKSEITHQLGNGPVSEFDASQLRGQLENARIRLRNAAMELTRVELEAAKQLVSGSVKQQHEYDSNRRVIANLRAERNALTLKLDNAHETTHAIRALVAEHRSLGESVSDREAEKDALERSIIELKDKIEPFNAIQARIEEERALIKSTMSRFDALQRELGQSTRIYQETEGERSRSLYESDRVHKERERLQTILSKVKDDIFLLARDHERLDVESAETKQTLQSVTDELDEVEQFPLETLDRHDDDDRLRELEALDLEAVRLSVEIEKTRDKRFRERMPN